MLHLTNGKSIIPLIREAGIGGAMVPWDDVLHEGPVPAGLGPVALRERRVDFLASCGWGARAAIMRDLAERDAAVEKASGMAKAGAMPADEIVLWFEHDLYDQLQLLQILDTLPIDMRPRLTIVPADTYLGSLPASQYQGLFAARRPVTSSEWSAARDAWIAFRSPDPRGLVDVLPRVTVMPHMAPALMRHLQQFPSLDNGLSRTEQQTLEAVNSGARTVRDVYLEANHARETAVFMGDAAFLFHITSLFRAPQPLLRRALSGPLTFDEVIEITDDGRQVLDGQSDRVSLCGIDRWLGGVHVEGHGPVWRWDAQRATVRMA